MSTLHDLTLRTATAVGRLAELQRRAERMTETRSTITKTALTELSTALEELHVANEALQDQLEQLKALRLSAQNAVSAADEVEHALPIAAVWTDRAGVIDKANDAACQLLNVGKHHLVGKPLMLFITDRSVLFAALRSLCEADHAAMIDVDITVRPRERRPRKMNLAGRRLQRDTRLLWFFHGQQLEINDDITRLAATA